MANSRSGSGSAIPFLDLRWTNALVHKEVATAWQKIMTHGKFLDGPEVDLFEQEFATYCGVAGCVGVANGTDALELILRSLDIGPGDEVIVPTNTFVATPEAVCAVGARPHFVDVRRDTLLMDEHTVREAINHATAAIILVHLFGQMVDYEEIIKLASKRGVLVIEDAAQAHGSTFSGRRAGAVGKAAAFSFYPGKNLGAMSNAGAVVSNDFELLSRIRSLANHGRDRKNRSHHILIGRNSRLDSLQAAVLSAKLRHLEDNNSRRISVMRTYRANLPKECVPLSVNKNASPVYHLAVVRVQDRLRASDALTSEGIGWGIHYPVPCHLQPAFSTYSRELPVAEEAAMHILSLPMSPNLTSAEIDRVCASLDIA
ncbi:DegT/DnrJ/EryC1/StrS family aminotransferase [Actinophytocola algeriensis]|uniref:dTDP-4-amino-4,6-dideoxygalactose transaminase n=1 Tax=Actinophytocola algeriensis TaxID=1768010 RepID=A0A7W7QD07_9PSEU|nr:DegT/DnrJ/EryC1/StrS family aminotransferase [Actinophytocola algeriensis]MBB4911304.1 dTDP-4-amino-4,6-dideoxygalactose transaminase [Actinophytocola algeriensis]MBE1479243.1 dTDP-4-amino-4,6-dideoxygalactose transaminase [Actinophytocola algeriensis]